MQLVAYGAQDIYLTGNPQITFFKVVYRRHTNFSMETIEQTVVGVSELGTSESHGVVTISRNGDLVTSVYVTSSSVGIMDGDALVKEVSIEIGGQLIDRHHKEWNQIWNELTTPASKIDGLKAMKVASTEPHNASGDAGGRLGTGLVQVPLNFWFCRNAGLALPLIALQYHEVELKFTWGTNVRPNYNNDTDTGGCGTALVAGTADALCKVYCDYIYLDTDERRRFAQVSHEYLIEQVQTHSLANRQSNELTFNHPVKELIWTSGSDANVYETAKLVLNGADRFTAQEEEYFQLRQPYQYHTHVPTNNLPNHHFKGVANPLYDPLLKNANAVYVTDRDMGLVNAAAAEAVIMEPDMFSWVQFEFAGGGGLTTVSPDTAAEFIGTTLIKAATTQSCALMIGGLDSNTCFEKNIINAGDLHHLEYFNPQQVFTQHLVMTVKYVITSTGIANQTLCSGAAGPVNVLLPTANFSSGPVADPGVGRAYGQMHASSLVIVYEEVVNIGTGVGPPVDGSVRLAYRGTVNVGSSIDVGGTARIADTSLMNKRINVYSFALKPEEHQPSGTCNFSRIDSAILETGTSIGSSFDIYAVNYNVLRIMSGMGGLAYSN